jgi:hypothetical protein
MANISSPFTLELGTPTQSSSAGGGMGAVPGPAPDYPIVQTLDLGTSGASFDSPYNEAIVQSTSTVTSADPGGSSPMESPFKDAIAK